ncbi:hypothetical protein [Labedella endophytica]|uniref:Uncharacterized protein n=1 Tax=Labedella endophytica TaxID=1523160 RepID=A0A3S0VRN2_9MICO|nr:hypothetical protein [Labedella endophytica]RUQ98184.1 hypothetical protein ELQ94_14280 [Labedella endophytica]
MTDSSARTLIRRHARWVVSLLAAPAIYFGGAYIVTLLSGTDHMGLALLGLVMIAVTFIGPVIAFIISLRAGIKVLRAWALRRRHAKGKFTPAESLQRQAWSDAEHLLAALSRREAPATIRVWDLVPNQGEVFFYDVPSSYARYYGRDVTYSQSSGFAFGHPAFVLAAVGASAIGNVSRRSQAEAMAREQWREHQGVRLVVSNQRLLCQVGGQWLSFYYSAITALYPETEQWTLVCQFDSTSPLMLRGEYVPSASLITTLMTHGVEALEEHPSLARLRSRAGATERSTSPDLPGVTDHE